MKTIGVREFLRGAYKELDEPVLVMSHSRPLGVWTPSQEEYHFSVGPGTVWLNSPIGTTSSTGATFSSGTLMGSSTPMIGSGAENYASFDPYNSINEQKRWTFRKKK